MNDGTHRETMATCNQCALRQSRARICSVVIFSLITILLAGCTLGNQANQGIIMKMSPASLTMQTRRTQQFTATITGSSNTGVAWTATGGTNTSTGMYTAPGSAGSFVVTATSM